MDGPKSYGEEIYRIGFGEAVEKACVKFTKFFNSYSE
jgi:predicted helicase